MGRFEPIHDAHAIEHVSLALQTSRQLDNDQLLAAGKAAEQFRPELPGGADIQTLMFGFGTMPPPIGPNLGNPFGGRVLHRVSADGTVEREFRIDRSTLSFRSSVYTRWDALWGQARRYFEALMPFYIPGGEIAGVSLNYVDKFYWEGDVREMRPKFLLRQASKYVSPVVYEADDLWHSHFGAFSRASDVVKHLVNINLDCLDENRLGASRRIVSITTLLTDMMNQPGYAAFRATAEEAIRFFSDRAGQLHVESKACLAEVLDDRMCKRIELGV